MQGSYPELKTLHPKKNIWKTKKKNETSELSSQVPTVFAAGAHDETVVELGSPPCLAA